MFGCTAKSADVTPKSIRVVCAILGICLGCGMRQIDGAGSHLGVRVRRMDGVHARCAVVKVVPFWMHRLDRVGQ